MPAPETGRGGARRRSDRTTLRCRGRSTARGVQPAACQRSSVAERHTTGDQQRLAQWRGHLGRMADEGVDRSVHQLGQTVRAQRASGPGFLDSLQITVGDRLDRVERHWRKCAELTDRPLAALRCPSQPRSTATAGRARSGAGTQSAAGAVSSVRTAPNSSGPVLNKSRKPDTISTARSPPNYNIPARIRGATRRSVNSSSVTTPRFPPPPQTPQDSSGSARGEATMSSGRRSRRSPSTTSRRRVRTGAQASRRGCPTSHRPRPCSPLRSTPASGGHFGSRYLVDRPVRAGRFGLRA